MASPLASNMTWSIGKNGVVVNILSHDSEDRKLVDGFEGKESYVKNDLYLGQEWAVSRKYLTFQLSLHIASILSNKSVKVVCFSVLTTQQAGGYHVTAFSCCIGGGGEASLLDFQKCARGATFPNICVDSPYSCNCYPNIDRSWLEDNGYLTEIFFVWYN